MAKTEAQIRATRKWEDANYDVYNVRVPKGTKERIKALGETLNGFSAKAILDALDMIERDGK